MGVGFHVSLVWALPPSTEACCVGQGPHGLKLLVKIRSNLELSHQLILKFYPSNISKYQFYISFILVLCNFISIPILFVWWQNGSKRSKRLQLSPGRICNSQREIHFQSARDGEVGHGPHGHFCRHAAPWQRHS